MHGKLKCPLGGEYVLQNKSQTPSHWTSTAWKERSLQKENDVPPEYRFPFLSWLKNLDLDFNLRASSLSSEIVLDVAAKNAKGTQKNDVANNRNEPVPATPLMVKPAGPIGFGPASVISRLAGPVTNVVYVPGGQQAVVVGFDRMAQLCNLETHLESQVFKGHQNTIWTLAISPDGKTLITGGEDKTLRAWNSKTGQQTWQFTAQEIFSCVRFSNKGEFAIATNWDGKVRIWHLPEMELQCEFEYGVPTLDVALRQDETKPGFSPSLLGR